MLVRVRVLAALAVVSVAGLGLSFPAAATAASPAVGASDGWPPELVALDASPDAVQLGGAPEVVTVTLRVRDESGTRAPVVGLDPAYDGDTLVSRTEASLSEGTTQDGLWTASVVVPSDVQAGDAHVVVAPLTDIGGASESRDHRLGRPITITGPPAAGPDTLPPTVQRVQVTPDLVNVSTGPQEVTVRMEASDPSGVTAPHVYLVREPGASDPVDGGVATLESGTVQHGVWAARVTVGGSGYWGVLLGAPLTDGRGNHSESRKVGDYALRVFGTAPAPPESVDYVSAQPRESGVELSWPAPRTNAPVTSWTISSSTGRTWRRTVEETRSAAPGPPYETTVDVPDQTPVSFTMTASNEAGEGAASRSSSVVVPGSLPPPPTDLRATAADGAVTLTWRVPDVAPSRLRGFRVEQGGVAGGSSRAADIDAPADAQPGGLASYTLSDLENGVPYRFSVATVNDTGAGEHTSSVVVTPRGVPGRPSPDVQAGNGHVAVTWGALGPYTDGGSPALRYTIRTERQDGPADAVVPATVTVPAEQGGRDLVGLTNGATYRVFVSASNRQGDGPEYLRDFVAPSAALGDPWSDPDAPPVKQPAPTPDPDPDPAPPAPPAPPRVLSPSRPQSARATTGNGSAVVSWTAPASNGGGAVTSYKVRTLPSGPTLDVAAPGPLSTTVRGLTNGVSYRFAVSAVNAGGESVATTTPAIVPVAPPSAPRVTSLVAGKRTARLSWSGAVTHGSPVTAQQVSCTGAATRQVGAAVRTTSYAGLRSRSTMSCVVRAQSAGGWSPWSSRSRPVRIG